MEKLVRRRQTIRTIGRSRFITLFLTVVILGLATVSQCASPVTAFLDARRFTLDQSATLSITINGADGTIGELPPVEGLIFQRRGQSSQHQFVNGSFSSSVSTLFEVQASRPGTFTIPPIPVTVDGKQLLTEAITFEVTSPTAGIPSLPNQQGSGAISPPPGGDDTGQMAFLRISPVKRESYVGEVLPLEIKAYFRRGLRANLNTHPRLNGDSFVLSESKQEPVQTEEVVDNVPYSVLTWPGTLSGIKEGKHGVSVTIEATLLVPAGNNRRRAPLGGDPFFGNDLFADFFNQQQMQEKKIQLVSKDMELQVLPLPTAGKPADFNGAIGKFEFQAQAQPTEVGQGDPITLTMTIQGTGNFERVEAPVLSEVEGWKSYPPAAKFTPGKNPGQGSKVFDQALIAKNADKTAIPPLSFSFFDPEAGKYQTLHSAPIPLRVNKTEKSGEDDTSQGGDNRQGRPDVEGDKDGVNGRRGGEQTPSPQKTGRNDAGDLGLAPQHAQTGSLQQGLIPLVTRGGWQMVILLLLLILVAVILLKVRARRLVNNPVLSRRREMARRLDLRMQEIAAIQERGSFQDLLAICRKAMQEQLGLLWQTGPAAITLSDLRQRLPGDSPLISLFATAEGGVYAGDRQGRSNGVGAGADGSGGGHLADSQARMEYIKKMEDALRQLQ